MSAERVVELERALAKVRAYAQTAYERGFTSGKASNERMAREAVTAMENARQVTLDENAKFTELLERLEARVEELELELSGTNNAKKIIAEMVMCPELRWSAIILELQGLVNK